MTVAHQVIEGEFAASGDLVASNAPTAKVLAASGGSALGGALGTVITWMTVPPTWPPQVQSSMTLIITAACSAILAYGAGWLKRPECHAAVIHDRRQRPRMARRIG